MSTTIDLESQAHPIARFSARVHDVLDELAFASAWSMTADEQRSALVALARAEARMHELRLRVLAAADTNDIAVDSAATSTTAWVAHQTRQVRGAAQADVRLAQRLDDAFTTVRESRRVDTAQARMIVAAVDSLPESVASHDRERAEKHLVHLAGEHDAKALKILGRRVFEAIDPEAAGLEEGRKLEAEERAAARGTYLHLFDSGDGTHTGRFKIPTLHAEMLTKMLHAFTAPRRRQPGGSRPTRPELMGLGFELLERYPASRLPKAGGVSANVVVLLDYDKLLTGIGTARLDTGTPISAASARRLMCERAAPAWLRGGCCARSTTARLTRAATSRPASPTARSASIGARESLPRGPLHRRLQGGVCAYVRSSEIPRVTELEAPSGGSQDHAPSPAVLADTDQHPAVLLEDHTHHELQP